MTMMEWTVIIGGLTAIAWINWYFFLAQAMAEKRAQQDPEQHPTST